MIKVQPLTVMICQLVRNARPTLSKPGVLYAVLLGVTWRRADRSVTRGRGEGDACVDGLQLMLLPAGCMHGGCMNGDGKEEGYADAPHELGGRGAFFADVLLCQLRLVCMHNRVERLGRGKGHAWGLRR